MSFISRLSGAVQCGAIAIELYLKCVTAEQIELPVPGNSGVVTVHAHELADLFRESPPEFREQLKHAWVSNGASVGVPKPQAA
jgi:hypothetical protein